MTRGRATVSLDVAGESTCSVVLVHGAWHGAWCWDRVVDGLAARGVSAFALDLPGHGDDPAPLVTCTRMRSGSATCSRPWSTRWCSSATRMEGRSSPRLGTIPPSASRSSSVPWPSTRARRARPRRPTCRVSPTSRMRAGQTLGPEWPSRATACHPRAFARGGSALQPLRRRHDGVGAGAARSPADGQPSAGSPCRLLAGEAVDLRRLHRRPDRPSPVATGDGEAVRWSHQGMGQRPLAVPVPTRARGRSTGRIGPLNVGVGRCAPTAPADRVRRRHSSCRPGD